MKRVVVKIAYLGEGFNGSQIQPTGRTVESEVLDKLMLVTKLTPGELDLKFSSRTDKGVNALGNAISFNSLFTNNSTLLRALNAVGGDKPDDAFTASEELEKRTGVPMPEQVRKLKELPVEPVLSSIPTTRLRLWSRTKGVVKLMVHWPLATVQLPL